MHDPMGKAYYDAQVGKGLSHNQAVLRLARRLSDIVYAMMRDKTEYNPMVARESMDRRAGGSKKTGEVARPQPMEVEIIIREPRRGDREDNLCRPADIDICPTASYFRPGGGGF